MRNQAQEILRQESAKDSGFILRGCPNLSGDGNPAGEMPEMRDSEKRKDGLAGKESFLHEEVLVFRRQEVPDHDHFGCIKGAEAGLAYSQRLGKGVYGGAAPTESRADSESHRDRRGFEEKGPCLQDSGERSGTGAADLVRRHGQVGRKHGHVLQVAWREEGKKDLVICDGHVESVREIYEKECPAIGNTLRQIPCYAVSGEGIGHGKKDGVCPVVRREQGVHQGSEIHFAVQPGKSNARRKKGFEEVAQGKQETQYGLSSQGDLWTVMGLSDQRLVAKFF